MTNLLLCLLCSTHHSPLVPRIHGFENVRFLTEVQNRVTLIVVSYDTVQLISAKKGGSSFSSGYFAFSKKEEPDVLG